MPLHYLLLPRTRKPTQSNTATTSPIDQPESLSLRTSTHHNGSSVPGEKNAMLWEEERQRFSSLYSFLRCQNIFSPTKKAVHEETFTVAS